MTMEKLCDTCLEAGSPHDGDFMCKAHGFQIKEGVVVNPCMHYKKR